MARKKLPENPDETKMSLGEHLDELRSRIIRALLGLVLAMGVTLWFGSEMLAVLKAPFLEAARECSIEDAKLITNKAPESFMMYFRVCLLAGFILASPWIFYQMWQFIAAGLYPHERKYINWGVPFSAGLFCLGAFVFLALIAKQMMLFFLGFGAKFMADVTPLLTLREYISLMTTMMLVFGMAFQLPIVIFILGKMGLVTVKQLNHYRRHAIVIILVVAALATSPSPVDQIGLAVPMWLLYEIGILLVYFFCKPKDEEEPDETDEGEEGGSGGDDTPSPGTALATTGGEGASGGDDTPSPGTALATTGGEGASGDDATTDAGGPESEGFAEDYSDGDYDDEQNYGDDEYGGEEYQGEDYDGYDDGTDDAESEDDPDDWFREEGGYVWTPAEPPAEEAQSDEAETEESAETEEAETDEAQADEAETEEADEPQADEAQADEPQTDEPQADETQADEAQADEPQTDEPQTDEAQADEAQADDDEPNETEADDGEADEPQADDADPDADPDKPDAAAS